MPANLTYRNTLGTVPPRVTTVNVTYRALSVAASRQPHLADGISTTDCYPAWRASARRCTIGARIPRGQEDSKKILTDAAITNALSQTVERIREGDLEQAQAGLAVLEFHRLMRSSTRREKSDLNGCMRPEITSHGASPPWGSEMPKMPWLKRKLPLRGVAKTAGKS
jgi:hypothetical protein